MSTIATVIPMRIVETSREGFDEPVVEIWRDDEFIGMVFWDDEETIVQIYPDDDGDVKDLDARELLRVLDLAEQIVSPYADPDADTQAGGRDFIFARRTAPDIAQEEPGWEAESEATLALVSEFDERASLRSDDGEGYFSRDVAESFIKRCDELDLAVVEMDGLERKGSDVVAIPEWSLMVKVEGRTAWAVFRPAANARALDALLDWPDRRNLLVAFVVQQPGGETFVA